MFAKGKMVPVSGVTFPPLVSVNLPVFTFIFVWHRATFASPAVITVTLGVQTGSIDTTVAGGVEAIIWNYNIKLTYGDVWGYEVYLHVFHA